MSIFYHNDDPLLFQRPTVINPVQDGQQSNGNLSDAYAQLYKQQLMKEMQMQNVPNPQQPIAQEWLSDLDNAMKGLDSESSAILNNDSEFVDLNSQLQSMIQGEIMSLVKVRLNSYPNAVDNIKKQLDMIKNVKYKVQENERKNMNELNDYMKNYSHLTFDEYRKIKYGEASPTNTENKPSKSKKQ